MDIVMWNNDKSKPILVLTCTNNSSKSKNKKSDFSKTSAQQTKKTKRKIASVKIDLFESIGCDYEYDISIKKSESTHPKNSDEQFMVLKPCRVGIPETEITKYKNSQNLSKQIQIKQAEKSTLTKRARWDWQDANESLKAEENQSTHLDKIKKFLVGSEFCILKFVKLCPEEGLTL